MPKPQQLPKEHKSSWLASLGNLHVCMKVEWNLAWRLRWQRGKWLPCLFSLFQCPLNIYRPKWTRRVYLCFSWQHSRWESPQSWGLRSDVFPSSSREPTRHCKVHAASGKEDTSATLLNPILFQSRALSLKHLLKPLCLLQGDKHKNSFRCRHRHSLPSVQPNSHALVRLHMEVLLSFWALSLNVWPWLSHMLLKDWNRTGSGGCY